MLYRDIKRDERPQKGGWAPGNYWNKCPVCKEAFVGDKRAGICADCAYDETPKPQEPVHHICAWMIEMFQRRWKH